MKRLFVFLALTMLAGCASSPPATQEDLQHAYPNVDAVKLFNAGKLALLDRECEITLSDANGGILKGKHLAIGGVFTAGFTGNASGTFLFYDVLFLGQAVRVNIYAGMGDGTVKRSSSGAAKPLYDMWWEAFDKALASL